MSTPDLTEIDCILTQTTVLTLGVVLRFLGYARNDRYIRVDYKNNRLFVRDCHAIKMARNDVNE